MQPIHLSDEVVSTYLDGELEPEAALVARAHLDRCPDCSATLARFSSLDATLASAPQLTCSAARPVVSAALDGENGTADAQAASAHLAGCAPCRAEMSAWAGLDAALASLPLAAPSPRVDAALAPLRVPPRPARRGLPGLPVWPARAIVAVALAIALVLLPSLPRGGEEAVEPDGALVALQQSVFNPRTGTLYVLHPAEGAVAALEAATLAPRTLIKVGGRPSALALNEAANLILVLDALAKTVTEIDGSSNAVIAATPVDVPGTPTSLQVDTNGKLVVTSIVVTGENISSAPPLALRTSPPTSGAISVLDGGTKKLETVKQVDVAPRQVVLEPGGKRALLVSSEATTIVDAATYKALDRTVGGIAGAFSGLSGDFAILSVQGGGALLSLSAHPSVPLAGSPRAITSLPGGGFAVLTEILGRGRITVLTADGTIGATLDAVGTGRDLTFDDATRQLSIVGAAGVSNVALPSLLAAAPSAPASSAPSQIAGPSQSPAASAPVVTTSPAPSASPSAPPSVAPSAPPVNVAPVVAAPSAPVASPALVPTGARLLCCDTYLYAPSGARRATAVAGDGTRIWMLDASNRLSALHTETGEVFQIASLPASARITAILPSPAYVYLTDITGGTLYVLTIRTEQWAAIPIPFLPLVTNAVASPDDRLWMIAEGFGLISFDPRSRRTDIAEIGGGSVSAVGVDGVGRVWLAPRDRGLLDVYDPLSGKLSELFLPHEGLVTALVADHDGAIWAATDTGQIFAIRNGKLVLSTTIGRAIDRLVLGPQGAAWYVSRAGGEVTFGPADGSALPLHAPAGVSTPVFDALGRSWTNDPASTGFFVTLPGSGR